MENIKNNAIYLERMEKGIADKLFFLEFLDDDITTVVDFGCANAALGKAIQILRPDLEYVGFDNNHTMLMEARQNLPNAKFFEKLDPIITYIKNKKAILVLSSVIHEVYSYSDKEWIEYFWDFVRYSGFAQVSIRDMGLSNRTIAFMAPDEEFLPIIKAYLLGKYNSNKDYTYFFQYYQMWLKYWYQENWERESNENYFSITTEEIKEIFAECKHTIVHESHFIVPWVENKVIQDFGINPFKYSTHYEMVLKLDK